MIHDETNKLLGGAKALGLWHRANKEFSNGLCSHHLLIILARQNELLHLGGLVVIRWCC
jgi:hypothetical protein